MNPEEYKFIKKILIHAQELPVDERLAYVQEACKNKPELIQSIMDMLSVEDSADGQVMEKAPIVEYFPQADIEESIEMQAGEKINQYTIIKKIGTGGMGIVYLAKQNYPAERQVALKLIQQTPKQQQLIAETQILAKLNHPNIATLYEIDKTEAEQLYIAMEYIEGEDIINWCKSHQYSIIQTLKLFQQLCAGIGFAHEKGIIHCDIKPNNVLVTSIDDKATVKIIDFGISQLNKHDTVKGEESEISGTPAYLAPEILAQKEILVNDTRRDVYALGILLKKLLHNNSSQLPQDLQAIIDKASANERENRYPSPVAMSNDLDQYFNKHAISARKPTFWYLTGLFIRRRFIVVLVSLAFVLTLIGGYINQSRLAKAAQVAQVEAEELSTFMTDLFNVANPEKSTADAITAVDLLNKAQIKLLAIDKPTFADARFMHTIGEIFTRMGKLEEAKTMIEKSIEITKLYQDPTGKYISQELIQLGLLNKNLNDFESAEKNLLLAIELLKKQEDTDISQLAYAHNHLGNLFYKSLQLEKAIIYHQAAIKFRLKLDDKKLLADSYNNLGVIYREQEDISETLRYMNLALNLYEQEYGPEHAFVGIVKSNLAIIEEGQHHFEKSERLMVDAHKIFSKNYGTTHYNTLTVVTNLIRFYDRRMRLQDALNLYEELAGSLNESTHYDKKLALMTWVELVYAKNNQYEKANKIQQQIFGFIAQKPPSQKYLHERIYTRNIQSLLIQEQFDLAWQQVSVVLNLSKNKLANDNYLYLNILNLKANISFKTHDIDAARATYQHIVNTSSKQRLAIIQKIHALIGLAKIYRNTQQLTNTHNVLNKALKLSLSIKSFNKKVIAIIHYQIGMAYLAQHKPSQAKVAFEKTLAIQILELPSQHPDLLATQSQL